jgi:uncharacterized protein
VSPPAHAVARVDADDGQWDLLPLRFERLDSSRVLLTNVVGEHLVITDQDLVALVDHGELSVGLAARLRARQMIRRRDDDLALDLLAMKLRTRHRRLADFTSLHMFVVTLRCEHACGYCQVSRRGAGRLEYDMSDETARRSLDLAFRSPAPAMKIEFQGGEPLLNFDLIRLIVHEAKNHNEQAGKDLAFVIATNLALLDDEVIEFCREHDVYISTSLDGPAPLHDRNRPRPGGDSWRRTVAGIERVQRDLGPDRIGALMTTTRESLSMPEAIIDTYRELGLTDVFLRPLSPYGFARRRSESMAYEVDRWLEFYERGLRHILGLNRSGVPVTEVYASFVLKKMLSNDDPGYVDLQSPAGLGIGGLVYNYDGDVYAADEGRMLAEMGDHTFRLGNIHSSSYAEMLTSDVLLDSLDLSFSGSTPMCADCAFEPFCGSDPLYHHAVFGDVVGRKPESAFCRRNMGVFRLLLDLYERDADARRVFRRWAAR